MIDNPQIAAKLCMIRQQIRQRQPLIHCITHPIAMNDCANLVLAAGARPIMASHPDEVAEITASADVLAVNLGNITAVRMEAMKRAAAAACSAGKPILIDLTGVACSRLRENFARQFIAAYKPAVIKGNISEIRLLCGLPAHASGVDAGAEDHFSAADCSVLETALKTYASRQTAVVFASGAVDLIADDDRVIYACNGTPRLTEITGTGCMLGVLAGVYLAAAAPVDAAALAAMTMGLAGEYAAGCSAGPGSFHTALFDAMALLTDADVIASGRLTEIAPL